MTHAGAASSRAGAHTDLEAWISEAVDAESCPVALPAQPTAAEPS